MPGVTCVGVDNAAGTQLGGGQDFVTVDGALVVLLGDQVQSHGIPPHSPAVVMVQASSFVTVSGIPICLAGHAASCQHAATGRSWITASE